jgi:excisionase family DNA binding protein
VINPYELLDTLFPGSFPREARFKLAESPARDTRLNLQEAAEYLGFTTRKLKDLCREKRITHSRPDYRTYRFTRADLEAYLAAYRKKER